MRCTKTRARCWPAGAESTPVLLASLYPALSSSIKGLQAIFPDGNLTIKLTARLRASRLEDPYPSACGSGAASFAPDVSLIHEAQDGPLDNCGWLDTCRLTAI